MSQLKHQGIPDRLRDRDHHLLKAEKRALRTVRSSVYKFFTLCCNVFSVHPLDAPYDLVRSTADVREV